MALFLLSSNVGRNQEWNPVEKLIIEITAPFQEFIKKTIQITEDIWLKYFFLINVHDENIQLKRKLDSLRVENYRYRESIKTNKRLHKLLQFKKTIHWPVLVAQVIGRDPTGRFQSIIINEGEKSGLKINMPVVNARGVVGRLVSVSQNYAKVLLLIDQNSAVDCIIQRSRDKGIVKGLSSKICKLHYVVKTSDVVAGDIVVTSGFGRVFPKGVPIGKIIEVNNTPGELFKDVKVRLFVNFSKLEELLVIMKEDLLVSHWKEKD